MKLSGDKADKVAQAESTGGLMEEGIREFFLKDVEEKPGTPVENGGKGPFWTWVFKIPEDAPAYVGRQLWLNTSLSESSEWRLKEVFEAFGVPADTDTDLLIGKRVLVMVGSETAQQGKMKGQLVNVIQRVLPLDGANTTDAAGKVTADSAPLY